MAIIFGNNGDQWRTSQGMSFVNGPKGPDSVRHSGGLAFSGKGTRRDSGNLSFAGGTQIRRSGNLYFAGGNTYRVSGGTLFGPGGKQWHKGYGSMTDAEVRDIIDRDL